MPAMASLLLADNLDAWEALDHRVEQATEGRLRRHEHSPRVYGATGVKRMGWIGQGTQK